MTRHLITLLICATALSAGDAKEHHKILGPVLGQKAVDTGHVLEARAIAGKPGLVLIRWGDVNNAIGEKAGKGSGFAWSGSASAPGISLVKEVAFEDGAGGGKADKPREPKREDKPKHEAKPHTPQDRLTNDNNPNTVTWDTKTSSAWDGVVVKAASGATMSITSGPATITVTVP